MAIGRFYTRTPKLGNPKHAIKRDPQRHKLYAMERTFVGQAVDHVMHRDKLTEVLKHACKRWGCKAPTLTIARQPKYRAFGWIHEGEGIVLNAGFAGQNLSTMLHELAHWITDELYDGARDHGPTFCSIYADLMDQYKLLPRYCFLEIAERFGVEVEESVCGNQSA